MSLFDTDIRSAKPGAKTQKLFDGGGLYLEISPQGGRYWRIKFRVRGTEKRLSLGVYPDVPLKFAREKRDDLRKQLALGIDPSEQRKAEKASQVYADANSFEVLAREWHSNLKPTWTEGHAATLMDRLQRDALSVQFQPSRPQNSFPCSDESNPVALSKPHIE